MTEQTTTRRPFTSTTWASILADQSYLSRNYARDHQLSWTHTADLAHELVERQPHLSIESSRVLTDFCPAQLPVMLTWTMPLDDGRTETITTAVIVEYMSANVMHIRYSGFGHLVQLSRVVSAESFKTVVTYS